MELEQTTTYKLAKTEFEVESLHKEIEQLKLENSKLLHYKHKWESMTSLKLKLQEASQTIYSVENMVMNVDSKINN